MGFSLSQRDLQRLSKVHPDLVKLVVEVAQYGETYFMVGEGVRSSEKQREMVQKGLSQTMNSRHLLHPDGYAYAVDLLPLIKLEGEWKVSQGWAPYYPLARDMKAAAEEHGVALVWGGDWKSFKDGPHFELDRKVYPGKSHYSFVEPDDIDPSEGDYPYEKQEKPTVAKSRTMWAGGSILGSIGGSIVAWFKGIDLSDVTIICATVIVVATLIILRDRLRRIWDERIG